MIFAPIDLTFVDLDDLVRIAGLFTAAFHVLQHLLRSWRMRRFYRNLSDVLCV